NPLGPAPGVADAIRGAIEQIVHYPEHDAAELRCALAQLWSVDADQILPGNGATDLIYFLSRAERLRGASFPHPAFSEFYRAFPSVDEQTVVLTQPVNPTGEWIDIQRWIETDHTLIVDESFIEFAGLPSAARFVESRKNLFVLRSLTKFYALPGLRLGA